MTVRAYVINSGVLPDEPPDRTGAQLTPGGGWDLCGATETDGSPVTMSLSPCDRRHRRAMCFVDARVVAITAEVQNQSSAYLLAELLPKFHPTRDQTAQP